MFHKGTIQDVFGAIHFRHLCVIERYIRSIRIVLVKINNGRKMRIGSVLINQSSSLKKLDFCLPDADGRKLITYTIPACSFGEFIEAR